MGDTNGAWTADEGFEMLGAVLAGTAPSEVSYEPVEIELFLWILYLARQRELPWDGAWFLAHRHTYAPRTAPPEVQARIDETRAALHEIKPHLRAIYDGLEPTALELERIAIATERRLNRLLPKQVAA